MNFIKVILFLVIALLFQNCINCELLSDAHRKEECLLVVSEIPDYRENYFNYKGYNPDTKEKCDCRTKTSYRWWGLYSDHIEKGDTIIKRKGELVFNIHKKDTILSFNFECEGHKYK